VLVLQELEPFLVPAPLLPLWITVEFVKRQVAYLESQRREDLVSGAARETVDANPSIF
jgi:hypothetical protein